MKFIALALSLFSLTCFARGLDSDILRLQQLADVGTNGGDASIITYDRSELNYRQLVKSLMSSIQGSDCGFTPVIGREQVLRSMSSMVIYQNSIEAEKILNRLHKAGQLKAALGYTWNGDEGDSEYCSVESLDLFFSNGKALVISYDSTT